jgi:hypothetical protein
MNPDPEPRTQNPEAALRLEYHYVSVMGQFPAQ